MKKVIFGGALIVVALIAIICNNSNDEFDKLYNTVKDDFSEKHPDYEFIDCKVGEGDPLVAYVHIRFKTTPTGKIQEEVWQYWDADTVWLHRDKYLEIKNKESGITR